MPEPPTRVSLPVESPRLVSPSPPGACRCRCRRSAGRCPSRRSACRRPAGLAGNGWIGPQGPGEHRDGEGVKSAATSRVETVTPGSSSQRLARRGGEDGQLIRGRRRRDRPDDDRGAAGSGRVVGDGIGRRHRPGPAAGRADLDQAARPADRVAHDHGGRRGRAVVGIRHRQADEVDAEEPRKRDRRRGVGRRDAVRVQPRSMRRYTGVPGRGRRRRIRA